MHTYTHIRRQNNMNKKQAEKHSREDPQWELSNEVSKTKLGVIKGMENFSRELKIVGTVQSEGCKSGLIKSSILIFSPTINKTHFFIKSSLHCSTPPSPRAVRAGSDKIKLKLCKSHQLHCYHKH